MCRLIQATLLCLFIVFFFPVLSSASFSQEECLGCHDKYNKFEHGKTTCIQCHSDITSIPHDDKLKKPSCSACHSDTIKSYTKSIHRDKNLGCKDCHDVHFPAKDKKDCLSCHKDVSHKGLSASEKHIKNLQCLACHGKISKGEVLIDIYTGKQDLIKKTRIDPDGNQFLDQIEWNSLLALMKDEPRGRIGIKKHFTVKIDDPHLVTKKPLSCQRCHHEANIFSRADVKITGKQSYSIAADPKIFVPELPSIDDYNKTVHGKMGIKCSDCHFSTKDINDSVCVRCHEKLYGLYKDTAHSEKGATRCTDCHNPHYTKPYKEIGASERLKVCARCHKDYIEKHTWLPHSVLHFRYLECSTCHSPASTKSMVFTLSFRDGEKIIPIKYHEIEKTFGQKIQLEKLIDTDRDGSISCRELTAFFNELRKGLQKEVFINSSIIVTRVYHSYSEKNTKTRICADCHSGSAPFYESMFLSMPQGEKTLHIPVKGTVLSAFPISLFIDMCLIGEGKINKKDFLSIIDARHEDIDKIIDELGFKLIDMIGISFCLLIIAGIAIHIIMRILVKK